MIARFLGEDALGLAFAIRECDPDLAEHIYQIAEDHNIAAQEAVLAEFEESVRRISEQPL